MEDKLEVGTYVRFKKGETTYVRKLLEVIHNFETFDVYRTDKEYFDYEEIEEEVGSMSEEELEKFINKLKDIDFAPIEKQLLHRVNGLELALKSHKNTIYEYRSELYELQNKLAKEKLEYSNLKETFNYCYEENEQLEEQLKQRDEVIEEIRKMIDTHNNLEQELGGTIKFNLVRLSSILNKYKGDSNE